VDAGTRFTLGPAERPDPRAGHDGAIVIASEAKQSGGVAELDCFVAIALRNDENVMSLFH
jgi:hypothetical protein